MKYFTALADATFARSAFAAAGLDFDAAIKAGNVDVLKKSADLSAAEEIIAQAKIENETLSNQLAAAVAYKADAEKHAALSAAVVAAGLDATKPEGLSAELDAKLKARATKEAVSIVARAGHPGVEEPIAEGVKLKAVAAIDPSLTGIERTIAAMKASAAAKK